MAAHRLLKDRKSCLSEEAILSKTSSTFVTLDPLSDNFYEQYCLFKTPSLNNNVCDAGIFKDLSENGIIVVNPAAFNYADEDSIDKFKVNYSEERSIDTFKVNNTKVISIDTLREKKHGPLRESDKQEVMKGNSFGLNAESRNEVGSEDRELLNATGESATPSSKNIFNARYRVFLAIFVRFMLIGHNSLTVWRVTVAYNDDLYWLLLSANVLLMAEGAFTVCWKSGIDYKWWCPCFLIYLASTLPGIWLLQLKQYEIAVGENSSLESSSLASMSLENTSIAANSALTKVSSTTIFDIAPTNISTASASKSSFPTGLFNVSENQNGTFWGLGNVTEGLLPNILVSTDSPNSTDVSSTDSYFIATSDALSTNKINLIQTPSPKPAVPDEIWLIIVQESLVYLLVIARWLLPRRKLSREFLADLLLEFLAIASDIMELLAVFDEAEVRRHRLLNYWIMAVWSASFIQFIPVLAHKRRFHRIRRPQMKCFTRACGEYFVEIIYTCMSIVLQDGPFLVVRLYIIIQLKLITYSLVFFVLKNIVSLLLLFYRLGAMCFHLPCCKPKKTR